MIPDLPNLATVTLPGRFKQPFRFKKEPFCDYARGGVELLDASQGLDVKDWRIDFEDGVATITSEGSPDFVVPDLPINLSWISFAFDQNMHYNVTYTVANKSYLYWYDAVAQGYVTTELDDVKTPFLRMDDVRNGIEGTNDLILSYLKKGDLYIRLQSDRFGVEYLLEKHAGNKFLQCGMTEQLRFQWKTTVVYPETLPCPQADMDLKPRERRYLSDIGDVRNMRMFQQEFQATHNKINFIFTEEEAAEFRDWYENVLLHGGAWFYANWPLLHKDTEIAHRFVGQPKWEWLFGANPGKMGRSRAGVGFTRSDDAVTMYKVSATIEVYERKVENVYVTEIYPVIVKDDITASHHSFTIRSLPFIPFEDDITISHHSFNLSQHKYIYTTYPMDDDITATHHSIVDATLFRYIYTTYPMDDDITATHHSIVAAELTITGRILYDYAKDDITSSHHFITVGETG